MIEPTQRKFRMPLWKWSLRSAAWAVPVGVCFAPLIGFAVILTWLVFCVDTIGPDPVEHPIPQWRKYLGDVAMTPGLAMKPFYPKDALAGAGLLIQRGIESFLFGLPYSWSFFFLLFLFLGLTPLNRETTILTVKKDGTTTL